MSRGLLLGLGMFLVEDEVLNTLTGAAAPPNRYPLQAHVRGLVTHLILGVVTESILSALASPRDERASQVRARQRRAR